MNEIIKSIILFIIIFSVVFFGGQILNLSPVMLFISGSVLVVVAIGYQASHAIKKNKVRGDN